MIFSDKIKKFTTLKLFNDAGEILTNSSILRSHRSPVHLTL